MPVTTSKCAQTSRALHADKEEESIKYNINQRPHGVNVLGRRDADKQTRIHGQPWAIKDCQRRPRIATAQH